MATQTPNLAGVQSLPRDVALFATYVAEHTGLSLAVVVGWMQSERGPIDNPLNIMGSGQVRHFGSPVNAAKATVSLLKTPRYTPILRSAGHPDQAQLKAIAASPWEAHHYGGDGRNLIGAYQAVLHGHHQDSANPFLPRAGSPAQQTADAVTGAASGVGGAIADAENWLAHEGTTALLYVTFSILAIAFLVLGGVRAAGGNPLRRTYTPPNLQGDLPAGF